MKVHKEQGIICKYMYVVSDKNMFAYLDTLERVDKYGAHLFIYLFIYLFILLIHLFVAVSEDI